MSTNFSLRKAKNRIDSTNPLSHQIVDADCVHEDGKFIIESLPSKTPGLFSIRFTAPADYAAGNTIMVNGKELPVRTPGMAAATSGIFKAGAVVRCDIDMDRELAFFWQGGEGCAGNNHGRKLLTGDLTLYIRKDGDDANSGLSEGDALLTWEGAVALLSRLDGGGYTVNILVGEGMWEEAFGVHCAKIVGFTKVHISGKGMDTVISAPGKSAIWAAGSVTVRVSDVRIAAAQSGVYSGDGAVIEVCGTISVSACTLAPFTATMGGRISLRGDAAITCSNNTGVSILYTNYSGYISVLNGANLSLTGTNSGTAFAIAQCNANIVCEPNCATSGIYNGKKHAAAFCGVIHSGGKAFPGTAAGEVVSPGFYW